MKRLAVLFAPVALIVASCTAPPAEPPKPTAESDSTNAAELRTKLDELFRSIDEGTADTTMMSWADPEAVVFDFDENNNPVAKRGTAEIQEFLASLTKSVKEGGLKIATNVVSADCKSTVVAGFCTTEFDQTFTKDGQTMGPFKFRGTLVARKMPDGWKWLHWHGSFREMPPPAAPQASAAPGATPAAY
jgi:ketosteroid isomerase-like protein